MRTAFLAAALFLAQDETALVLKFTRGQKLSYVQTTSSEADHGEEKKGTVTHETTYTLDVLDLGDAGQGKLKTTFDRFRVTLSGVMEKKFDSSNPEDLKNARVDSALKIYAALTGRSLSLWVTPEGKIEQTDVSELVAALETDEEFRPIVGQAKKIGGDMMNHSFCSLPDKAVKPGDQWKDSRAIDMGGIGKVVMDGTYTLEGVKDGLARIAVDMAISLQKDPQAPASLELKEAAGKGLIEFDVAAGNIKRSKTATHLIVEGKTKSGEARKLTLNQQSETLRQ